MYPKSRADALRNELKPLIEAVLAPLMRGHDERICIIDPPGHANVGDSAILLGELDYLDEHHSGSPVSFYDIGNYSAKVHRYIDESSILLLHGGGNFGDLWPRHHEIRKTILRNFRHKRVVQFPQSISFSTDAELRETQELVDAHPDFHLIVRDKKSYAFAQSNFNCEVSLCPDMAFAMRPIQRRPAERDVQCLLRGDKEVAADHDAITAALTAAGASFAVDDWLEDPLTLARRLDRKLNLLSRNNPSLAAPFRPQLMWARRLYARERVDVGVALLSRGRYVVTDRLHAHILSSLLDIPHFVFNSLDGKIGAFHDAWMAGKVEAWMVDSPAALQAALGDLLRPQVEAA